MFHFDGQKVNIFFLKNLGQSSKMWQYISLQIDCCNKVVSATRIHTGPWLLDTY